MRGGREQPLHVNPSDAAMLGLGEGDRVRVSSKDGTIEVAIKFTEDLAEGTVALAHGWGHRGGWKLANSNPGVNVNVLAGASVDDLEPLAGMAFLNGIAVSVEPAGKASAAAAATEAVTAAPSRD
jgi:formate dehydrogenase